MFLKWIWNCFFLFLFQIEDLQSQIKYLNESIQVTQGTFETVSAKLSLMASLLIKLMCSISLGFQSVGAIEPIAPRLTRQLLWATWKLIMIFNWKKTKKEMTYYGSSRIRPSFTSLVCLFVIVFSFWTLYLVQKFMKIDVWSQLKLFCYM